MLYKLIKYTIMVSKYGGIWQTGVVDTLWYICFIVISFTAFNQVNPVCSISRG